MFAILQISKADSIFRKLRISSQRIILPNGETFFVVNAENIKGTASLKKLESCLGILKKDIVLCGDTPLPGGSKISVFTPDILPRLLLINSALDILKNRRYKCLILYDEKGIYPHLLKLLTNSFDRIRVITPVPNIYSPVALELMASCGFSLEVSATADFDGDVIISDRLCVPLYYSGTVFTNEKKYLMNARVFSGSGIILPDFYENLRPKSINPLVFASALYEKCGVGELSKLKYKSFDC